MNLSAARGTMKLGAFVHETGQQVAAWRHPGARRDSGVDFGQAVDVARTAERSKFDPLFLADGAAVSVFGSDEAVSFGKEASHHRGVGAVQVFAGEGGVAPAGAAEPADARRPAQPNLANRGAVAKSPVDPVLADVVP